MGDSVVAQAERIAGDVLLEQVTASYPIIGKGITNQVCAVETASRKVVVRMNNKETYPNYMKEKWCIEQAATVGIPGPEVLSIGVVDDTAYTIQTYISGDNGADSPFPRAELWRQLGEYARRISSIPVIGYGENLLDPVHGEFHSPPHAGSDGSWVGYVQYNINSLTESDPLLELGVTTWIASQKVRTLFEYLKQRNFRFGLNHGDLSLKNTIVNQAGRVILLDWDNAGVRAVPHGAVVQLMQYQLLGLEEGPSDDEFQVFLDGYGIGEQDVAEARHLLLLNTFDNLRWAIDRSPDLIESYAALAKQVVDMIID